MKKILIYTILFCLISLVYSTTNYAAIGVHPDYQNETEIEKKNTNIFGKKIKKIGFFKKWRDKIKLKRNKRNIDETISKDVRTALWTGGLSFFFLIVSWIGLILFVIAESSINAPILGFFIVVGGLVLAIGTIIFSMGIRIRMKKDKSGADYSTEKTLLTVAFILPLLALLGPILFLFLLLLQGV